MRTRLTLLLATLTLFTLLPSAGAQQKPEGPGESLGKQIDRGVKEVAGRLRRTWAEIRQSVDNLEVEGRVYARLHWDQRLATGTVEVDVAENNVVILKGTVPSVKSQELAVELASQTTGVERVVDQLTVLPPQ